MKGLLYSWLWISWSRDRDYSKLGFSLPYKRETGPSALAPLFAQSIGYLLEAILSLYSPARKGRDQIILGVAGANPRTSFLLSESLPDLLSSLKTTPYSRCIFSLSQNRKTLSFVVLPFRMEWFSVDLPSHRWKKGYLCEEHRILVYKMRLVRSSVGWCGVSIMWWLISIELA